jgi:hypothetical protein
MDTIEIYYLEGTENLFGSDSYTRGYQPEIYVIINEVYYKINIYTINILQQDFESAVEHQGYYPIDPNIILVKEASNSEIIWTVSKLHKHYNYFKDLKPLDKEEVKQLQLVKME